jgi:type I restriction enzyme S subunit
VDFDPVRAKADGRNTGLPAEIAALFPDSFEDSELGEIPKGWDATSFTDNIEVIGGGTPKTSKPEYWDGDIPWFSVVDTPADGEVFVISTKQTVTQSGIDNSSARILPVGTTIISARGTVGNLALVGVPMAMNQSCYGLKDQRGGAGYFLYFATEAVVDTLRQRGHGSVFNTITRDTLHGLRVASPPHEVMAEFERVVQGLMLQILSNQHKSRTLADIRDALLPKLISGKLRVPNAERILERAM